MITAIQSMDFVQMGALQRFVIHCMDLFVEHVSITKESLLQLIYTCTTINNFQLVFNYMSPFSLPSACM